MSKKKKKFKRENSHKKVQTPESWRRPKGKHSRVRLEVNGAPAKPKAGYRTDKEIRGLHPSGYEEVLVHNTEDLEDIDPETEAARIGSTVGGKKRAKIIEKAEEEEIKLLNGKTEGEEE
ncbi:MAG: large subunit ribosomal protein L32e [Candidatus Nanohaloarchaea archaeon]|jgi:large subunit ribosomal protein L32e